MVFMWAEEEEGPYLGGIEQNSNSRPASPNFLVTYIPFLLYAGKVR